MGNAENGFELLKDPAPLPRRCAFCRQEVGSDVPIRCGRCAALYHSDCWPANGRRCAIYGCEPAEKPVAEAPAPAPRTYRLPAASGSGWGRNGWIIVAVVIPNVIRLLTSMSTHSTTTKPIAFPPAPIVSPTYELIGPRRSLFFERGCLHYDVQDWKECVSDFGAAATADPSLQDAAQIRIFFARCRAGEAEEAARMLRGYLKARVTPEDRSWAAQSLRFVAGLVPESEFLDDDIPIENGSAVPERACEAYFYAGTLRLIAGDESRARDYFALSVATRAESTREHMTAKRELEALERKR